TAPSHGPSMQKNLAIRAVPHMRHNPRYDPPDQRDWNRNAIAVSSRVGWQAITGYCQRARAESLMGHYKSNMVKPLHTRKFAIQ
ncbi:IS5/IS1182 family transposase, partial [Pseudochrobactrum kiredjianiae]